MSTYYQMLANFGGRQYTLQRQQRAQPAPSNTIATGSPDGDHFTAWEYSARLCSIHHRGSAPCFFPSDFLQGPRRPAHTVCTLVQLCPALTFHAEYHKKLAHDYLASRPKLHMNNKPRTNMPPNTTNGECKENQGMLDVVWDKPDGTSLSRTPMGLNIDRKYWQDADSDFLKLTTTELTYLSELVQQELDEATEEANHEFE